MRVQVIAVGRVKGPLGPAVDHYRTRAERYWKLEVREVREGRGEPSAVLRTEGERILDRTAAQGRLWALSRSGRPWSSTEWARHLERVSMDAHPTVDIVLGGAWGLDAAVLDRADRTVSLSRATLPHDLARLVLFEQLYRAGTILRGEPYHKGPGA